MNERSQDVSSCQLNGTSGSDFKLRVQLRILQMSKDLKNPSPIKDTSQGTLESYLKKDSLGYQRISTDRPSSGLQNPIDVSTARFLNNHGGALK